MRSRAAASRGESSEHLYARARQVLLKLGASGRVVDVGCGRGALRPALDGIATTYVGLDAVRYDGFPERAEFVEADLDRAPLPLPDAAADVAIALETIEHLENPRQFVRELARITRPGGWVLLSTPNQLSLLSRLTLLLRGQFRAFQDADYPAHITALLESDLRRIAGECGLRDVTAVYSGRARMALTAAHFPSWLSGALPRAFSDHVLLAARVPVDR
ncbi:MAG TPA: methyltransferase domain-containing protein [Vicinamibacterales bacterium]|nr:methyltransferase domain-containing protein [Vicinamibacterales bacterium]